MRALSNRKKKMEKVRRDCKTCTGLKHEVGKCSGRKMKCYACGKLSQECKQLGGSYAGGAGKEVGKLPCLVSAIYFI